MLTPEQIAALEFLAGMFLSAEGEVAAYTAWQSLMRMIATGGMEAVGVASAKKVITRWGIESAFTAAEVQIMKNVAIKAAAKEMEKQAVKKAAQGACTMAIEEFIPILSRNFIASPKGPGPMMAVITIALLLTTTNDVYAATRDIELYKEYLVKFGGYLDRRMAQGDLGRGGHVAMPMEFEEWQDNQDYIGF